MVLKDGVAVMALSVAGGDLQDQAALNCLLNRIEFDMTIADAVTAPRFSTGHHEDSFKPWPRRAETLVDLGGLRIDQRIDGSLRPALEERGHRVTVADGAIATPVMIHRDAQTGMIDAAGDPQTGRHAAGLP